MRIPRLALLLIAVTALPAGPLAGQESTEPAPDTPGVADEQPDASAATNAANADSAAVDEDDEPEREVIETDDESYLDIEEEDFTPSEEIPTDQSISFPVDI